MSLADVMADQLRMPSGPLAPFAARTLNRRNHGLIQRSIAALEVQPGHRVLDVGFGGGLSLSLLVAATQGGLVAGVDPSAPMVGRARRMFDSDIRAGRVVVERGRAEALPFDDESFDRVLSTQTVYYWSDVDKGLAELRRVLVPRGRLVLALMARAVQEGFGFVERGYNVVCPDALMGELRRAGFDSVRRWPASGGSHCVVVGERRP